MRFHQGRLLDHVHIRVADLEASKAFYTAVLGALESGFSFEGPGYYGAYVLDPDGNNIEAVYHGPTKRSAASVEVEPA